MGISADLDVEVHIVTDRDREIDVEYNTITITSTSRSTSTSTIQCNKIRRGLAASGRVECQLIKHRCPNIAVRVFLLG